MRGLAFGLAAFLTATSSYSDQPSVEQSFKRIQQKGQGTELTLQRVYARPKNDGWTSEDYTKSLLCEQVQQISEYTLQNCIDESPRSIFVRMQGSLPGGAGSFTLNFYNRGADDFNEGDFVVAYFDNKDNPMYFIGGLYDGRIMETWIDPNDSGHRHSKRLGKIKNFLAKVFEVPKVEKKYADFLNFNPNTPQSLEKLIAKMQESYAKRLQECKGDGRARYSNKQD